ncbi:uncharacterized protein DS421_3g90820 [Arachis hypogaea]|nr:uncharacterized protein DS421_3g90820 [Arachis hypogaea]
MLGNVMQQLSFSCYILACMLLPKASLPTWYYLHLDHYSGSVHIIIDENLYPTNFVKRGGSSTCRPIS